MLSSGVLRFIISCAAADGGEGLGCRGRPAAQKKQSGSLSPANLPPSPPDLPSRPARLGFCWRAAGGGTKSKRSDAVYYVHTCRPASQWARTRVRDTSAREAWGASLLVGGLTDMNQSVSLPKLDQKEERCAMRPRNRAPCDALTGRHSPFAGPY